MDETRELKYQGKQSEEDVMPKVNYEDIPEERRRKWRSYMATFDGIVSNDEEFEEWLAVFLHFNAGGCVVSFEDGQSVAREFTPEEFEKARRDQAEYYRTEYNHIKAFRKWRVENLDPEIKKLADMAANASQYDWQDLYALERQKLLCMRTYFSHSRIADENGHFDGEIWLDICLSLLEDIEADGMGIPYDKIKRMNIRNIRGLVDEGTIEDFVDAPDPEFDPEAPLGKDYYGRKIYVRKMERLYHLIRLYKTRDWWE
jgi:hypothetical protein